MIHYTEVLACRLLLVAGNKDFTVISQSTIWFVASMISGTGEVHQGTSFHAMDEPWSCWVAGGGRRVGGCQHAFLGEPGAHVPNLPPPVFPTVLSRAMYPWEMPKSFSQGAEEVLHA